MRSGSRARVVIASLGISVVITLGCGTPGGPSGRFSVLSISPTEGTSAGGTPVVIGGTGFIIRSQGATVTVDGILVNASPSLDGNTIRLVMPAHATGKVDVTVTAPLSQAQASVPGGYSYVDVHVPLPPPPVISELVPNIGSTGGGTPIEIRGARGAFWGGGFGVVTVTFDGIVSTIDDHGWPSYDTLYLSTPAHAAGTVEVIVTDRYGQAGSSVFTYASPATFDFNGDWQAVARGPSPAGAVLALTIRDNIVVSVSCSVCRNGVTCDPVPSPTLDPPPVVANGEFSFAGSGGVSITGKILSPNSASGSINMASCVSSGQWTAGKK